MKQFQTESKRLLELMINSIYTHKEIFLRELISNASDAIDKLAFQSLTNPEVGLDRSDFRIRITADKDARTLTISDNGIGMSAEELEENLGTIAKSGSLEFKQKLADVKADESAESQSASDGSPIDVIGQFGVGFYSAFMVAEKVTVQTKAFGADTAYEWTSSGADGYEIAPCGKLAAGTEITLYLKPDADDENYGEYLESYRLKNLIKKYSDYIRYPIQMDFEHTHTEENGGSHTHVETEIVNSMVPIWQRPKSEVSDEDCEQFYKDKYYESENPLSVIRVSAEGLVSFRAMLFIPAKAPYNYYTRDFQPGLQLYTSGVMVMDKCADLLPECFRFVRGIVDSQDLSLNISREMLQHDRQLRVISQNLEKRVKSELKKLMDENFDDYKKFWNAFGLQLKYGILGDFGAKKELLSDLLLFRSAKEKELIGLQKYVDAMPDGQKYIYYAFGENAEKLPQAEPVLDAGFDVLCLTEDSDEFVMQMLASFSEKELKSVNAEDLGLPDSDSKKEETEKLEAEHKELLEFVQTSLGDSVAAVKISEKLKSAPVCLSTQGYVTLEMERYFKSLPSSEGPPMKAERVLELNAEHKEFAALKTAYGSDRDKAARYAKLLYFQSILTSGVEIDDPSQYADLISDLVV
ncbi:MAG: molecular chaperone HtpG [Oscillospiraceae bacterium]|jgi:molecular chaperone HtpG|nr:molecular chaperone HtpG [Oscillospiraceae bacterium]